MREAEVLILDDLGSQQSSSWANEKLFQMLNYRYNMSMPTVITANPKGLAGIDERIRSRLTDTSLVIQVNFEYGRGYRPFRRPRLTPSLFRQAGPKIGHLPYSPEANQA